MGKYKKVGKKTDKGWNVSTISTKVVVAGILISIIIVFFVSFIVSGTIRNLEEKLIGSRLEADMNYVKDLISNHDDTARWNVKGDTIYFGDTEIGDGTREKANLEPFLEHYSKTGILSYVFLKVRDDDPRLLAAEKQKLPYEPAHYFRVAGSTLGEDGVSILGTFITKNVAEGLDRSGEYKGEANVAGSAIYCLYRVLKDSGDKVIGAMVVGRNVDDMNREVGKAVVKVALFTLFVIAVIIGIIFIIIYQFLNTIKSIAYYLKQLEVGIIPDNRLEIKSFAEMNLVAESINNLVRYMRENSDLQRKSEMDALTELPNRMSYDQYSEDLEKYLRANPRSLGVEILDIDYFKQFNDNYGHQMGDECIRMIAGVLLKLTQDHPKVYAARYGGDEFVIIYPGSLHSEIETMVKELKKNVQKMAMEHKHSKASDVVTITQGVCFDIFSPYASISDFLKRADDALYEEKKIRRNSYRIVQL